MHNGGKVSDTLCTYTPVFDYSILYVSVHHAFWMYLETRFVRVTARPPSQLPKTRAYSAASSCTLYAHRRTFHHFVTIYRLLLLIDLLLQLHYSTTILV